MKTGKRVKVIESVVFAAFLIWVLLLIAGCKKDDPQPVSVQADVHKLSVVPLQSTAELYINGIEQVNIDETFYVLKGDEIILLDNGLDSWSLNDDGTVAGKNEGRTGGKIVIDNQVVWEDYCSCDTYHIEIVR